jgi:hypothetical protein
VNPVSTPIRHIPSGNCARALTIQLAAAPPRSVMNLRRLIAHLNTEDRPLFC